MATIKTVLGLDTAEFEAKAKAAADKLGAMLASNTQNKQSGGSITPQAPVINAEAEANKALAAAEKAAAEAAKKVAAATAAAAEEHKKNTAAVKQSANAGQAQKAATSSLTANAGQAGEKMTKAAGAVNALTGSLGASCPALGAVGAAVSALTTGPLGIMIAVIGLAVAAFQMWKQACADAAAKAAAAAESAAAETEKVRQLNDTHRAYFSTLKELNSTEYKSAESKKAMAALVAALTKRFGELGLEIDKTSGRYKNLDDVENAVNAKMRADEAKRLEKELKKRDVDREKASEQYIDEYYLDVNRYGAEDALLRYNQPRVFSQGLALPRKARNYNDATEANLKELEAIKATAEAQYEAKATDADEIAKFKEFRSKIDDQIETMKKLLTYKKTGFFDEKSAVADESAKASEANNQAAAVEGAIASSSDIVAAQEAKEKGLEREYEIQKRLAEIVRARKGEALSEPDRKRVLDALNKELDMRERLKKAEEDARKQEAERLEAQRKSEDIANANKNAGSVLDSIQNRYAQQDAEAAGTGREYAMEQAVKGLDPAKVKPAIIDAIREAAGANYDRGEKEKADADAARADAEAKRADIDAMQGRLADLGKLNLAGSEIKTNSLTSRGGWKSGATVDTNDINRQIADHTRTSAQLLADIKQLQQGSNSI